MVLIFSVLSIYNVYVYGVKVIVFSPGSIQWTRHRTQIIVLTHWADRYIWPKRQIKSIQLNAEVACNARAFPSGVGAQFGSDETNIANTSITKLFTIYTNLYPFLQLRILHLSYTQYHFVPYFLKQKIIIVLIFTEK